MGIAEDIYARCRICARKSSDLLLAVSDKNAPDRLTVHARRCAADIAADAVYAVLGRAFITPVDREDLWLLYETAEQLWRAAEDAAIALNGSSRSPVQKTAVEQAAACCAQTADIVGTLPVKALTPHLRVLRDAQQAAATSSCDCLFPVLCACERTLETWRYIALKNT